MIIADAEIDPRDTQPSDLKSAHLKMVMVTVARYLDEPQDRDWRAYEASERRMC